MIIMSLQKLTAVATAWVTVLCVTFTAWNIDLTGPIYIICGKIPEANGTVYFCCSSITLYGRIITLLAAYREAGQPFLYRASAMPFQHSVVLPIPSHLRVHLAEEIGWVYYKRVYTFNNIKHGLADITFLSSCLCVLPARWPLHWPILQHTYELLLHWIVLQSVLVFVKYYEITCGIYPCELILSICTQSSRQLSDPHWVVCYAVDKELLLL